MTHFRHRTFNTHDIYPEQKPDNGHAQAVVAGGRIVFLRGQCPQDLDSARDVGIHDPIEQTHKVMQNIRQLLNEVGGRTEQLCKVVVYLTHARHREAVCRTMGDYIKGVHPISMDVVVTALAPALPVRTGVKVTTLDRDGDDFLATSSERNIRARNVVVATGPFQRPLIPTLSPTPRSPSFTPKPTAAREPCPKARFLSLAWAPPVPRSPRRGPAQDFV
jgi:enamine deaminase RidA (YjgF/YER057c/UK114 family)